MDKYELTPMVLNPAPNVTKVIDDAGLDRMVGFMLSNKEWGFDVETTPVSDFYWRRMRTIQVGNANEQYVVDLKAFCGGDSDLLFNCQGEYGKNLHLAARFKALMERLKPFLCSSDYTKVGVNLSFEYSCFYWLIGMRTYGYYDCMLVEKCIYSGLGGLASLKNYAFYSLEEMIARYFHKSINKELQTSFNLEDELSDAQYEYAAFDTRGPLAIKNIQTLVISGWTPEKLRRAQRPEKAKILTELEPLILGDDLREITKIENDAIGSFVDMHIHGERLDRVKWLTRVEKRKQRLVELLTELDAYFLPLVGSKNEAVSTGEIENLEATWKSFNTPSRTETELQLEIKGLNREIKKHAAQFDFLVEANRQVADLDARCSKLEATRKEQKELLKKKCGDLKKKQTKIRNLIDKCEGEALINYNSGAQLLAAMVPNEKKLQIKVKEADGTFKGRTRPAIEALDDDILEKWKHTIPVMGMIQEYHGLAKEIGTYGDSWATEWTTHPCKEEGWLHPGDHRLHCEFNQYDAETGRSSSSKPNGQNLPQGEEVRSCFVADPPDESIRISNCCDAEATWSMGGDCYECDKCEEICATHAEEYVIVTADMSGAELRIIAEAADDDRWILAFAKDEDVHSVGTELLYETEWTAEQLPDCKYFHPHDEASVAKNPLCVIGEPQRQKCKCPGHMARRNDNKSTNFLLAYGGGPGKLSVEIGKTLTQAKSLMSLHEQKNPKIWKYLEDSGVKAQQNQKAFDLFNRRRILPNPTRERAIENCKEWEEEKLRLPEDDAKKNVETFTIVKKRKPTADESYELTHRTPTANEIGRSYYQLSNGTKRQGKNHSIQGTNATIAKLAMSCSYDKDGIPYLWHTLPQYKAKLLKFVHDELVVQCPKRFGRQVSELIGDAFKRAAATKMKKVVMKFDSAIESYWKK